eukprot:s4727_g1.t1
MDITHTQPSDWPAAGYRQGSAQRCTEELAAANNSEKSGPSTHAAGQRHEGVQHVGKLPGEEAWDGHGKWQVSRGRGPYQFGLSTRAGTEGLYKLLHTATELDPRATVLSIDAVGAYDHVSRQAMLEGLRSYTWLDDNGGEHEVVQGEGGEQGDPLMPALYSLAQHAALSEAAAGLREIFAFLDDTYVVSAPERAGELHGALEDALWRHARIRLHQGKTCVWNAAGEEPSGLARLQPVGADPVWTGAWSLPGLLVLGAPLGSEAFVLGRNAWSRTSCSAVSLLSAICSPRGSSCCFVPRRVQTICFGCRPARRKPSHASTTPPSVLA